MNASLSAGVIRRQFIDDAQNAAMETAMALFDQWAFVFIDPFSSPRSFSSGRRNTRHATTHRERLFEKFAVPLAGELGSPFGDLQDDKLNFGDKPMSPAGDPLFAEGLDRVLSDRWEAKLFNDD